MRAGSLYCYLLKPRHCSAAGQLGVRVAGHEGPGHKHRRRRPKRGTVLPDPGHAGGRGLRAGHRPARRATLVRRPDHSTGAVLVRLGFDDRRRLHDRFSDGRAPPPAAAKVASSATGRRSSSVPDDAIVVAVGRHRRAVRSLEVLGAVGQG